MKELSDITICVIDRGTFFPVAVRLAREVKKVYYYRPNGESFETAWTDSIGHNYPNVEAVRAFLPIKNEIDVFVFPDCRDWDLQLDLESQGFAVWGSRRGEDLENMRGLWIETALEIGLPMPKTEVIRGLEALRVYLYEHRDETKFVKISRYRGDMETWKASDWLVTRNKLDSLAAKWQGLQNLIVFYVQDELDTTIEGGADSYFVGDFPDEMILGYEKKDMGYFGAVMERKKMPPLIWQPSELLAPVLKRFDYCNFLSSEIRVVDDKSYWLDPCCRCPSPAGEEQLEMFLNFAEIVVNGAHGLLVQPKWAARYCGELVISWTGKRDSEKILKIPEELRQWVKPYGCAYVDDAFRFSPEHDADCLGCVVGVGDTPEEMIDHLKEIREELSSQSVDMQLEPLRDLIEEIEEAREMGIPFGDGDTMPAAAEVLD